MAESKIYSQAIMNFLDNGGGKITSIDSGHDSKWLLAKIEQALDDGKAEDVTVIDLKGKADFADYMVVASGRSQRHISSLAEIIVDELRKAGVTNLSIEGAKASDWVLVDCIDVVVHIFHPELRKLYSLEKMWEMPLKRETAYA